MSVDSNTPSDGNDSYVYPNPVSNFSSGLNLKIIDAAVTPDRLPIVNEELVAPTTSDEMPSNLSSKVNEQVLLVPVSDEAAPAAGKRDVD